MLCNFILLQAANSTSHINFTVSFMTFSVFKYACWYQYLIHAVKGGIHLMFNPHMHEIFLLLSCVKWVPGTHKKKCSSNWTKWHSFHIILQRQLCVGSPETDTLIFGNHFYLKNPRKLRFHVLLLYSKVKLAEMVEIHILLRIWSTFGKMRRYMFSSIRMEECMESELSFFE